MHQYAIEIQLLDDKRSTEWVKRLPAVIMALANEVNSANWQKTSQGYQRQGCCKAHNKISNEERNSPSCKPEIFVPAQ